MALCGVDRMIYGLGVHFVIWQLFDLQPFELIKNSVGQAAQKVTKELEEY